MKNRKCVTCGSFIEKSSVSDPYLCRGCGRMLEQNEKSLRYMYLDTL